MLQYIFMIVHKKVDKYFSCSIMRVNVVILWKSLLKLALYKINIRNKRRFFFFFHFLYSSLFSAKGKIIGASTRDYYKCDSR